jgi:hypothetical protein
LVIKYDHNIVAGQSWHHFLLNLGHVRRKIMINISHGRKIIM